VHPGDLAQGCSDLEMIWLLCCAGAATELNVLLPHLCSYILILLDAVASVASALSVKLHSCSLTCIRYHQITKYTHIRNFPLLETSLFVLMSYATFLAAEAAQLTGRHAVILANIFSFVP